MEVRVFHHAHLGYCAERYNEETRTWEQISYWYHSLTTLNRHFAKKHGFNFETDTAHLFL